MALVKCPECGRMNVSDLAVACPNCGFPIKEHFSKIKEEGQSQQDPERSEKKIVKLTDSSKESDAYRRLVTVLNVEALIKAEEEKKERDRIENEKHIKRENEKAQSSAETCGRQRKAVVDAESKLLGKKNKRMICLIIALGVAVIGAPMATGSGSTPFVYVCACAFEFLMVLCVHSDVKKAETELELAKSDFEEYERIIQKEKEAEEKRKEEKMEERSRIYRAQHPICPQCGSNDTQRISTVNRAVSTATLGIASSTIGKQYKCNKCKHMW